MALGVLGLFVGAVVLSLGHRLWMWWATKDKPPAPAGAGG